MRVMMVGLGDIARKAYLPVLAVRPKLELHLVTRDPAVRAELGRAWRIDRLHTDLDEALAVARFDAAFVHAATAAHPALVARLLDARVPVLVDKPLADTLPAAEELVRLAERAGVPLFVGFNRRHAPVYAALRGREASMLRMDKHRQGPLHAPRQTVFDDFIHVVDTLRFLAPPATDLADIRGVMRGAELEAVSITLAGPGFVAVGAVHRWSGLDEERLDVIGGGARATVEDMAAVTEAQGTARRHRRGDWTAVPRQRGFEAMCDAFLDAVASGQACSAEDALETHRWCERIVEAVEGGA